MFSRLSMHIKPNNFQKSFVPAVCGVCHGSLTSIGHTCHFKPLMFSQVQVVLCVLTKNFFLNE